MNKMFFLVLCIAGSPVLSSGQTSTTQSGATASRAWSSVPHLLQVLKSFRYCSYCARSGFVEGAFRPPARRPERCLRNSDRR
jgi:hypothetical protein